MTIEFIDAPAASTLQGVQGPPTTGIDFISSPTGGGGGTHAVTYKMRALEDPGPGFLVWVVDDAPDYAGASAPGAIVGGSAVIVSEFFRPV